MTGIFATFFVILISALYSVFGDSKTRKWRLRVCAVVALCYICSAFIVSFSFEDGRFFLLNDPARYIERTIYETMSFRSAMQYLSDCYFDFADNNALYNVFLSYIGKIYKTRFDEVTPFALALTSVFFGILCSVTLFRILSNYYTPQAAFKYTLAFSLLSLFHFYSVVVLRDIIIAFFYLLCFEIVQKPFTTKRLIWLILLMLLAWGVRLYSGLFISLFIMYYLYISSAKTKASFLLIPMLLVAIGFIALSSMTVIEQSVAEIELYQEFTDERAGAVGGLITRLLALPPIIREISLTFFSQITPFPPYLSFRFVETFSNFYMSSMVLVYEVWWYSISFMLMYMLFVDGQLGRLVSKDKLILLIALVFIVANTAHPDIRRMMPVYPILYFYYLNCKSCMSVKLFRSKRRGLMAIYCVLLVAYYIIKG